MLFRSSKKGELERNIVRLKRATKVKKRVKEIRMLPSGPLLKELQLPGKIAFPALPSISQAGVLADLGREERFQKIARVLKEIVWGEDLIEMAREYGEKVEPMKRKIQEIDNEKKKRAIAKEIEELKDSFTFRLACRNPEKILSLNLEELSRYLEEVYKKIYQ